MNVVVTEVINIALMSVVGQHHQRSFGDHLPGSEMTIPEHIKITAHVNAKRGHILSEISFICHLKSYR